MDNETREAELIGRLETIDWRVERGTVYWYIVYDQNGEKYATISCPDIASSLDGLAALTTIVMKGKAPSHSAKKKPQSTSC